MLLAHDDNGKDRGKVAKKQTEKKLNEDIISAILAFEPSAYLSDTERAMYEALDAEIRDIHKERKQNCKGLQPHDRGYVERWNAVRSREYASMIAMSEPYEALARLNFARQYREYIPELKEAYRRASRAVIVENRQRLKERLAESGLTLTDARRIDADNTARGMEYVDPVLLAIFHESSGSEMPRPTTRAEFDVLDIFSDGSLTAAIGHRTDYVLIALNAAYMQTDTDGTPGQQLAAFMQQVWEELVPHKWTITEDSGPVKSGTAKLKTNDKHFVMHANAARAISTIGNLQNRLYATGRVKAAVMDDKYATVTILIPGTEYMTAPSVELIDRFRIDGYDLRILNEICSLIHPYVGNMPIAIYGKMPLSRIMLQIYPKNKTLTKKQSADIETSIMKMNRLDIVIDCPLYDAKTGRKKSDAIPQYSSILPCKIYPDIVDGRPGVLCVELLDVPPLYSYVCTLGQFEMLPAKAAALPDLSYTRNNIAVHQYLLDVIAHAKWMGWDTVEVSNDSIYKAASATHKGKEAKRGLVETAEIILAAWEEKRDISDYTKNPIREGRTYKRIITL